MTTANVPSRRHLFGRMIQDSALYTVALLVQRVVGVCLLPINTRFLQPSDYGTADLLEQVGVVIALLMGGNIAGSLGYFYFQKDGEEHHRNVAGTTVIGATMLGTLAAALCWPFAAQISSMVFGTPGNAGYLRFIFASIIFSFSAESMFSWLRVTERSKLYLWASILRVGAFAIGTLVFVAAMRLRVLGVITSSLIALVLTNLALGTYFVRKARPAWSTAMFVKMLRFTAAVGLGGVAMFVVHFGDRFILPHYRPMSDLGIYGVAYKVGMLGSILSGTFGAYWNAQVYQVAKRDDANTVFAQTFSYLMLVLTFSSVGLIVAARPVLRLLAAPAYQGAVDLVPILVLSYLLRGIADYFRAFFLVKGKPGFDATCNVIAAFVSLGAYFLLIPTYGIWGAAWATFLTFLVLGTIVPLWTHRLMNYSVEVGRLLKLGLVSAVILTVHRLVPVAGTAALWGWTAALLLAFPVLLWVTGFFSRGERDIAWSSIGRITGLLSRDRIEGERTGA